MNPEARIDWHEHIPATALPVVREWLLPYQVRIRVSRKRKTKTGDYRPPQKVRFHRISVNHDLQPPAFLLTLTHEIAHMMVWEQLGRKARPHGAEWKSLYRRLLEELFSTGAFPDEMVNLLRKTNGGLKATTSSDTELTRLLIGNSGDDKIVFLQDLPDGKVFSLPGGRRFIKKERVRKRYRCLEIASKRIYLVSPAARVFPEDGPD